MTGLFLLRATSFLQLSVCFGCFVCAVSSLSVKEGTFVNFDGSKGTHTYVMEGDVNLGAVFPIHVFSETKACGDKLRDAGAVQKVEALRYAINHINANTSILPGVKLGLVVLDDCAKAVTALGQAMHFMPIRMQPDADCGPACYRNEGNFRFYNVMGVIGSESSPSSIMMANVLGMFRLPQISPTATSDLLSDKNKFPFFMRMAPPNEFQVKAILSIIQHYNWTYISVIYSKGGYGESAAAKIKKKAPWLGICIGAALLVSQESDKKIYKDAVNKLLEIKAQVVVLFTDQEETEALFSWVKEAGLAGRFVWLGSDGLGYNIDDLRHGGYSEVAHGSLSLQANAVQLFDPAAFRSHFESLGPDDTDNPWFKEMWSQLFRCRWSGMRDGNTSLPVCEGIKKRLSDAQGYSPDSIVSTVMDSALVFAQAIDRLRRDLCPRARGKTLRHCVKGETLLQYLRDTHLQGRNGNISFDKNGNIRGTYEIINFSHDRDGKNKSIAVGSWDTEKLNINDNLIAWSSGVPGDNRQGHGSRSQKNRTGVPISQCGRKCEAGEVYSYFKDTCCWECRSCNKNEITTHNATRCWSCPEYMWPNSSDLTECIPLVPHRIEWHDPAAIIFAILSLLGVVYCSAVFTIFVRHNSARLIKATSRELSYMMLAGILIQYILSLTIVAKPTDFICYFNYIGFNVSFAVVYAPLLTRTNRIYRIFRAGKRTKTLPTFTSPFSQVIITLMMVMVQVMINIIASVAEAPTAGKRMPVPTDPFVELTCSTGVHGFLVSLSYNLLLVIVCSFYAFKTRTLPDNFNESRYISLCVYTTLIIWLAFLPTYFTTSRAFYQVILLSSALLLNASVILLCLFTPKIYAIFTGATAVTFKYNVQNSGMLKNNSSNNMLATSTIVNQLEDQATELTDFGTTTQTGNGIPSSPSST